MGGNQGSSIIPAMRYRDAAAAIDWLCRAFGFERHLVVPGPAGSIAHAQLRLGSGMVMLGSIRDNEWGRLIRQPDEIGGFETQSACVVVADPDTHHAQARREGARIVIEPHDEDHGGRGYGCRDLEGRLWYFGNYDPWADAAG